MHAMHSEVSTLSLHDALPIWPGTGTGEERRRVAWRSRGLRGEKSVKAEGVPEQRQGNPPRNNCSQLTNRVPPAIIPDRKSTRLNSSHTVISYAVFCLKKKNTK